MGMNVNILVDDPGELEKIRQKEMDITKDKIQKIIKAGTNVLMTTKGIDDMSIKYLVEAGIMAVRRVDKKDMRRIAKCTGAQMLLTLATLDGDEAFDEAYLGKAEEVCEQRVGDNDFVFIKGCSQSKAATILLRGANEFMLEEADRSVHDALCAVSRTLETNPSSQAAVPLKRQSACIWRTLPGPSIPMSRLPSLSLPRHCRRSP